MTLFYDSYVASAPLLAPVRLIVIIDPRVTSVLICRFMLSLRQFESASTSATLSISGSRVRDQTTSTVLEFAIGARPSGSLPPFIMSFAHPVHVDSALLEMDSDAVANDRCEREDTYIMTPTRTTLSSSRPSSEASGHPA